MNKKIKLLIIACFVLLVCLAVASCSGDGVYGEYDKSGYNITVKYDANGSYFGNAGQLYVTDTYSQESLKVNGDGKIEIVLVNPEDEVRGKANAQEIARAAMPGYSFAGWYSERKEAIDAETGNVRKDDKGNTVYIYSGKWDFNGTYLLDNKDYTASEPAVTFYAAWVRNPSVEIYDGENNLVATYEIKNPMLEKNSIISAPYLDLKKGEYNFGTLKDALSYGSNTKYSWVERYVTNDKTYFFDGLYLDKECQNQISADQKLAFVYDEATATIENPTTKLYISYEEKAGDWYRIYSAKQLANNAKADGNYEIMADLEFDALNAWPRTFTNNDFSGKIEGNGFKISGVSIESNANAQYFGMFKSITKDATIENVTFDGVSALVDKAYRAPGIRYAVVAASIEDGFKFENVEFSNVVLKITASSAIQYSTEYEIGLVCADGYTEELGVSLDGFGFEVVTSEVDLSTLAVTQNGNSLELAFAPIEQE